MTAANGLLVVVDDAALRDEVDRVAAAVALRVVYCPASQLPSRRAWAAAAGVVLDHTAVRRCVDTGLPRRARVVMLADHQPDTVTWQTAISLGAQHVLRLPEQEAELVAALSEAGDSMSQALGRGAVIAVIGGRGGAGASILSAAIAYAAPDALLVDVDPWGGGLDLLLGIEARPGLRWPDLAVERGRLTLAPIREALPEHQGVNVLSTTRHGGDVAAGSLLAIVEAGRRGGATVVCDLPRRLTAAAEAALDAADLVVAVSQCDVRSCSALAAMMPALLPVNPNVGLVVRGPSPGGLRAAEVAGVAGVPLLAAIRPERRLAETLEQGGLRLRRRSALGLAARRVLAVLQRHPVVEAA